MRRRAVGTWLTKGSMEEKSTIDSPWTREPIRLSEHPGAVTVDAGFDAPRLPATVDFGDFRSRGRMMMRPRTKLMR